MKQNVHSQTGRSLLETICVLVVIAILLLASIIGYDVIMRHWQRQQTVKMVSEIALRYRMRPNRVQGPVEMRPIYPEGDRLDSYTVKTADNGAVHIKVEDISGFSVIVNQVLDDTCEAILEKGAYDAVLTDPDWLISLGGDEVQRLINYLGLDIELSEGEQLALGRIYLNKLETDQKKAIIGKICEPNDAWPSARPRGSNGRRTETATFVLEGNCPESNFSFWYDGKCHTCRKNEVKDKAGVCCARADLNECGYCQSSPVTAATYCIQNPGSTICPINLICETVSKTCVECLNDGDRCCGDKSDLFCSHHHCCPPEKEWDGRWCSCPTGKEPCGDSCCLNTESCVQSGTGDAKKTACCAYDGSLKTLCSTNDCCESGNCTAEGRCCPAGQDEYTAGDDQCCVSTRAYTTATNKRKCCGVDLVNGHCPDECGDGCMLDDGSCIDEGDTVGVCGICSDGEIIANTSVGTICQQCNTTDWTLVWKDSTKRTVVTRDEKQTCCANNGSEKSSCVSEDCCTSGICTNGHCCPDSHTYMTNNDVCCLSKRIYKDSENKEKCCGVDLVNGHCPDECGDGCMLDDGSCIDEGDTVGDCGICSAGEIIADTSVGTICQQCNTTDWLLVLKETNKDVVCGTQCCDSAEHCVTHASLSACCANDGTEKSLCTDDNCCTSGNCTLSHCCAAGKFWSGDNEICVNCLADHGDVYGACPTTTKPVCYHPGKADSECRECPKNKPWWDEETGKCVCLRNYGVAGDGACPEDLPWCDLQDSNGPVCKVCPTGKIWNPNTHTCTECLWNNGTNKAGACPTTERPLCPTEGEFAWTCQPCDDDEEWKQIDGVWQCVKKCSQPACVVGDLCYTTLKRCKDLTAEEKISGLPCTLTYFEECSSTPSYCTKLNHGSWSNPKRGHVSNDLDAICQKKYGGKLADKTQINKMVLGSGAGSCRRTGIGSRFILTNMTNSTNWKGESCNNRESAAYDTNPDDKKGPRWRCAQSKATCKDDCHGFDKKEGRFSTSVGICILN